ncbi:MAG TPA: TetR/AcrR family transcriptional regulator C-terminal domain-containing protein [Candidatus Saccharimonadales bacterium]|jgi:AcrR family transcriptional regulator|nr:TetR/AcrR family transcriptional regulator C-terminal domain-containing protein [Candidatus Saccharimonadales bacterium]
MPTADTPHPKQERGLERQQIVRTALALLDEVGYSGLTLRKLADKLHVKAAALYWHFENKQDLIDAMAVAIMLDEIDRFTPKSIQWQDMLADVARVNRRALTRYRDGAQIIAHANMAQDALLGGMEFMLKHLRSQGFTAEQAMLSLFTVIRYTLGCVFEEQADPRHKQSPPATKRHGEWLIAMKDKYPVAAETITQLAKSGVITPESQFEAGLRIIIAGIQQQLDASSHLA